MLHVLLVDTLPILFRFPPKCLEISLAIVWNNLGLIKITLVSSEKKQTRTRENNTCERTCLSSC